MSARAIAIPLPAGTGGEKKVTAPRTAQLVSAVFFLAGAVTGTTTAIMRQLPSGSTLRILATSPQIQVEARYLANDQKLKFMNEAVCHCFIPIEKEKLPSVVKNALVAIEDKRFYEHRGIDWYGIGRALRDSVWTRKLQGGSTITQQLARTMVVDRTRRFPGVGFRKIREMIVARRLERMMTKEEIIAAFLNSADFGTINGRTVFGVEQAALTYYGKSASELNVYEAAQLMGMLNAPQAKNPQLQPGAAHSRTEKVLERMVEQRFIKKADADRALRVRSQKGTREPIPLRAGHYKDLVFYEAASIAQSRRLQGRVRLAVCLDAFAQARAERLLLLGLNGLPKTDEVEAALVAMRPDGCIAALVGGRDFAKKQLNRATQRRQPGSSFKPFVFATALEEGYTPQSWLMDAPLRADIGWPTNYDGMYRGKMTLRHAMVHSVNAATVNLAVTIGLPKIVKFAQRLGISSELASDPTLALGSSSVTLVEMTGAYGAFASAGRRVHPHAILVATDGRGYVFFKRRAVAAEAVVSRKVVENMHSLYGAAVKDGTGRNALLKGRWTGGKTGTSQEYKDAWFVGMTDSLVTGVWIGRDDNKPMEGLTGSGIPATLFRRFNEDVKNPRPAVRMLAARDLEIDRSIQTAGLPAADGSAARDVAEARRQVVAYSGPELPGTIVVDSGSRFLYLVQEGRSAIRYRVAVARDGFEWSGTEIVSAKKEWPDWKPPRAMRKRRPDLPAYMPGGPSNPLGARAIYLGSSLYRIHGSNEPGTVGLPVSSGCFRMRNEDVVDLYNRVPVGTRVVVN